MKPYIFLFFYRCDALVNKARKHINKQIKLFKACNTSSKVVVMVVKVEQVVIVYVEIHKQKVAIKKDKVYNTQHVGGFLIVKNVVEK